MAARDPARSAWFVPAIVWVGGCVILVMVGFGTGTQCTTTHPEAECGAIDEWAWFGVIAAGLVAVLPVSRSLREQVTPLWVAVAVGVLIAVAVMGIILI